MATSGRPLDETTRRQIVRMRESKVPCRRIAFEIQVSTRTIFKYAPPAKIGLTEPEPDNQRDRWDEV
jgi:hypothetical protein